MDVKEQLSLYIKDNERLVNELKDLRHYMINIIHGINGCIELEDWDGLKDFFNNILESYKHIYDVNLSSIEKIKNLSLKNLLLLKLNKASEKCIDFKIMADSNILVENELINEHDLYFILNVFLDKALEASAEACIKKTSIYFLTNKKSINIIIENTFKEKTSISNSNFSGDGVNRMDLQSAITMLAKYPHILNNIFVQHQLCIQELQILR